MGLLLLIIRIGRVLVDLAKQHSFLLDLVIRTQKHLEVVKVLKDVVLGLIVSFGQFFFVFSRRFVYVWRFVSAEELGFKFAL